MEKHTIRVKIYTIRAKIYGIRAKEHTIRAKMDDMWTFPEIIAIFKGPERPVAHDHIETSWNHAMLRSYHHETSPSHQNWELKRG